MISDLLSPQSYDFMAISFGLAMQYFEEYKASSLLRQILCLFAPLFFIDKVE